MGLREFRGGRRGRGGPVRPVFEAGGWGSGIGGGKPDYHTAALCKQVRRAVAMALAGECGDEVLQGLVVEEVLPAPSAGRLLVRVLLRAGPAVEGAEQVGVIEVLERLARVQGLLRARVGEAIVRKRTPELVFDVIPVAAGPSHVERDGDGEEVGHE